MRVYQSRREHILPSPAGREALDNKSFQTPLSSLKVSMSRSNDVYQRGQQLVRGAAATLPKYKDAKSFNPCKGFKHTTSRFLKSVVFTIWYPGLYDLGMAAGKVSQTSTSFDRAQPGHWFA